MTMVYIGQPFQELIVLPARFTMYSTNILTTHLIILDTHCRLAICSWILSRIKIKWVQHQWFQHLVLYWQWGTSMVLLQTTA